MDKIKLLMDKYGLPEDFAKKIAWDFAAVAVSTPEANEAIRPTSKPEANEAVIKKLIDAEPDWHKPAPSTYGIKYHVKQIDFLIGPQTYRIDDLALIEQIRKLIAQASFKYTKKYNKIRSQRPQIKKIAEYLIEYSKEPTVYKKRVFAGRIIGEFDREFSPDLSNEQIQRKVKNLFVA